MLDLQLVEGRTADAVLATQVPRLQPDSCSFNIATICSSLNLLRFMRPLSVAAEFMKKSEGHLEAQVMKGASMFSVNREPSS
jgi:hypothetical protein